MTMGGGDLKYEKGAEVVGANINNPWVVWGGVVGICAVYQVAVTLVG